MTKDKTPEQYVAALTHEFGNGFSSGIHALMLNEELPIAFDRSNWEKWFFKPADSAFNRAHNDGLIAPYKAGSKWTFTDFGSRVRALLMSEYQDSER